MNKAKPMPIKTEPIAQSQATSGSSAMIPPPMKMTPRHPPSVLSSPDFESDIFNVK